MKNKILLFIVGMFLISLAYAQTTTLGVFRENENVTLTQGCANSTYSNISLILNPSGDIILNQETIMSGNDFYSYNFTNTEILGEYLVYGHCNEDGVDTSWVYTFEITPFGNTLTTGRAIFYSLTFLISLLCFVGLIMLGTWIPSSNKTDEFTGYILAVSNLKYLKMFFLALSYVILVFISYFCWIISYGYLNLPFVASVMQFFFYTLAICTLPLFILYVYLNISNLLRDSKISEQLTRGLKVR
jgi:hypothetical protein